MGAMKLGLGGDKSAADKPVKERVSMEYLPGEERPGLWWGAIFAVIIAALILLHAVPSGPPAPPSPRELERKLSEGLDRG